MCAIVDFHCYLESTNKKSLFHVFISILTKKEVLVLQIVGHAGFL